MERYRFNSFRKGTCAVHGKQRVDEICVFDGSAFEFRYKPL
jgi:hypothetical protein